ncbi:MAG: LCP family protein [Rudaea sp.]
MAIPSQNKPRGFPNRLVYSFIALIFPLFLCGGVASAFYFYDTVREYVAYGNLPDFGSVAPGDALSQVIQSQLAPQGPNIAAGERVNVLILGIDRREGETGPWRTDTMIVATLDPKTKTGGMLAIPRDLYVPIPLAGVGENRINTANFFGDMNKYPGGGPALAKKTVEYNLGIPIHYYALIDFRTFKKIVDTLGGIDVDVPYAIDDAQYPTDDYRTEVIHIPAGRIHMDGNLALKYARTRHTTSDFDRSKRQMQIILACRDKALKLDMISKLPQLYSQFQSLVQTDMTLPQMIALAPFASAIRPDNIRSRSIDQTMTYEIRLNNGADVLWPDRSKISVVVNDLFGSGGTPTPKPEEARIVVLNGTGRAGDADAAASYLRDKGFDVVQIGNAPRSNYKQTIIYTYDDLPRTGAALAQALGIPASSVQKGTSAPADANVQIILGIDWIPPN